MFFEKREALAKVKSGLTRFPPAAIRYPASLGISATSDCISLIMRALTLSMSPAKSVDNSAAGVCACKEFSLPFIEAALLLVISFELT